VQVQITVADGKVTTVDLLQVPSGNSRDVGINDQAVPILEDETIQAQTSRSTRARARRPPATATRAPCSRRWTRPACDRDGDLDHDGDRTVEDPGDRTRLLHVVALSGGEVATSGTAARGRHITDPRTGRPAAEHVLSATVADVGRRPGDRGVRGGPRALRRVADLPGSDALLVHPDGRLTGTGSAAW